jgi:hypothetical protein
VQARYVGKRVAENLSVLAVSLLGRAGH